MMARAIEESQGLSAIIKDFKKYTSKALLDWITSNGKESRKEWMTMVMKYHAKYNSNNTNASRTK